MKLLSAAGVVIFLASQFLCQARAIELCEPQDYYNLADSTKCKIKSNKEGEKSGSRELMFEVLKNYPYENKDMFVKLLQKKITRVEDYIIEQKNQKQTEKVKVNIGKLEQTKRGLSSELEMVNTATVENWVSIRDQASKTLKEATIRLREVE